MSTDDLTGKVAFVTGGAGGLGQAIAAAFAARGAKVAVADLAARQSEVDSVARGLPEAIGVALDVRQPSTIQAAVQTVAQRLGSVDVMVCNAGLNIRKPSLEVTEQDWDFIHNVNLKSVFFTAQSAAKLMLSGVGLRPAPLGRIVNISSTTAKVALPLLGAYSASKSGLEGMSDALRRAHAGS